MALLMMRAAAAAALLASASAGGANATGCPGQSSDCDCGWTAGGAKCPKGPHPHDDGSECFCRCCCQYEQPGFVCKWKPPKPVPPPPPLPPPPPPPPGVTSPAEMAKKMGLGINLGNTLEAPLEGNWAPNATEKDFDEFKAKGFTNVRIPVRWDQHTGLSAPYTIDPAFLARVETVVGWSLARGFITVVNTHHDNWLDSVQNFTAMLPRFKAIWTQIAARFQSKGEELLFEVYNEPHIMTVDQLNQMNAAVHPIIRESNPNRIIILGGLQWMNPSWQVAHPSAMTIPRGDPQLMLEIHNYDPAAYALNEKPTVHSWGSASDIATLNQWMDDIAAWSKAHHLPIYYGEFGCTHTQNASTGRDTWYLEHRKAIESHGFAAAVWDDDGGFRVYDRQADQWDEGVLKALGKGSAGGCFSDHATKASCDASAGCAWCTSAAVPPACNTLADARKLPPSVFKCDKLAARAK